MSAEAPPAGIVPLFLRGATLEKFAISLENEYFKLSKASILKEIQDLGKISDFEPAKKQLESVSTDEILFVVDRNQKYGETILLYHNADMIDKFMEDLRKKEESKLEIIRLQEEQEKAAKEAEYARLNIVYEDKPISPRGWVSSPETEAEIKQMIQSHSREKMVIDVYRPKKLMGKPFKFGYKHAAEGKVTEFRSVKDNNFKPILESDMGIQATPPMTHAEVQTTWFQPVSKMIQYEAADNTEVNAMIEENREDLIRFLESATTRVELALQQNESVDIFHETFRTIQGDDVMDGSLAENELKETKNFADPAYSKHKALVSIDWVPRRADMLAVSAVRELNFDARSTVSGRSNISYICLWDFRQLVRPVILMESHSEVFTFRFNPVNPGFVAGGCISGQVVLWDISDKLEVNKRRGSRMKTKEGAVASDENDDIHGLPRHPVFISNVDYSHNKAVADLFWLPASTQINHKGHLVGAEFLDGKCYQFVTVAGDGQVMIWDIRYEEIYADNLKHVGRARHVPAEKTSSKEGGGVKPIWAPLFKVHLKRFEGVGEYSLCKACCTRALKGAAVSSRSSMVAGDTRSHIITTTEEGDILFVDLNTANITQGGGGGRNKGEDTKDEEEDDRGDSTNDFVKWSEVDQSRPSVALQLSPFFADIILTVGDWNFHIWKIGFSRPLFISPVSESYLTAACWSPTRPAVLLVACADGHIQAWDFTDTSYKPSIPLKATQARITSMQYLLDDNRSRQQLLAAGDSTGTLHIFELPRVLARPVHSEEVIMEKFLDRELQRQLSRHEAQVSELAAHNNAASGAAGNPMSYSVDSQQAVVDSVVEASAREEAKKLALIAEKKEEDDFVKMEQSFVTDLSLGSGELPPWMAAPPIPPTN